MHTSRVLDLRICGTWEPAHLLAEAFEWPIDAPAVALQHLVSTVTPASFADVGTPVITPAGVEPILGGVRRRSRKYQGAAYQVGSELRPGDLLVPRSPSGIALLVSDLMAGALVSASFHALRSSGETSALWLWGLLNCRSGLELRRTRAAGSALLQSSVGDLLDMPVPMPALVQRGSLLPALRDLETSTHIQEEEAVETWWRTSDLQGREWRIILASPRPDLLSEGRPLKDYCGEIAKGRSIRDSASESEGLGLLPVVDISVLSGSAPRRWAPSAVDRATRVHPGDLCVAAAGERPHAAVIAMEAFADPNVYVLRLREPALGPALARYLNGQEGFALRRMLITGAFIPNLRRGDLEQLPVRPESLDQSGLDAPVTPLADRLEHLLWSS